MTQATQKKSSGSKKKNTGKSQTQTQPKEVESQEPQQYDLTKPQKIKLTRENFFLLYKFVDGTLPEAYAPLDKLESVTPEKCPFCRSTAGYEPWDEGPTQVSGKYRRADGLIYGRWSYMVRCLNCGEDYRAAETWSFYVDGENIEFVDQG